MRILSRYLAALLLAGAPSASASDTFADAPTLANNSTTQFDNTAATSEPQETEMEKVHRLAVGKHTLWYRYVAPISGMVHITLVDYHPEEWWAYKNRMFVYHGNAFDKLTPVSTYRRDGMTDIVFPAAAGTEFRICISERRHMQPGTGHFTIRQTAWPSTVPLALVPPLPTSHSPANAEFQSAQVIPSGPAAQTIIGYNTSRGPNAEGTGGDANTLTMWYRWTAPRRGIASIKVHNPEKMIMNNVIGIGRGNSREAMIRVADNSNLTGSHSKDLAFPVEAGVEYRIYWASNGWIHTGPFYFTLSLEKWPYGTTPIVTPALPLTNLPRNHTIEKATQLPSKQKKYTVIDYNLSAPPGKPYRVSSYRTLWYRWTAPSSTYVKFSTPGYQPPTSPVWPEPIGHPHTLVAYSGPPTKLAEVGRVLSNSPTQMGFPAKKGQTYYIAHACTSNDWNQWSFTESGNVVFNYEYGPQVNPTGPTCKFTNLKKNQKIRTKGTRITLSISPDPQGIKRLQVKVGKKLIYSAAHKSRGLGIDSGKLKKGKVKIQARAQDSFGRWGKWATITVQAS